MTAHPLRSRNWFGRNDLDGFVHRSWLKTEGFSDLVFDGRPVIGIANSWSELTNCNAHLRQVADAVKRGVWSAGGFPLEFPTISLGEVLMKPTAMMFRNLMAMDVEECIRAYPLDAVVLLSGCDKTTPAMLMGAASADIPAIMVTGGPMLRGTWRTEELGSGTDVWRLWAERRAGRMTDEELCEVESCMSRSSGHCMVMGTASTMASMAEALGLTLPGNAAIPAPDSRRLALAELSGRRAVEMALAGGPKPSEILTAQAFDNAIRADMAIGGSTNAIIHLVAIAGRSEEHTSELQSRLHLVCRLLLEKKKLAITGSDEHSSKLHKLALSINPEIELVSEASPELTVIVGNAATTGILFPSASACVSRLN